MTLSFLAWRHAVPCEEASREGEMMMLPGDTGGEG